MWNPVSSQPSLCFTHRADIAHALCIHHPALCPHSLSQALDASEVDARTALTLISCNIFLHHNFGFTVEVKDTRLSGGKKDSGGKDKTRTQGGERCILSVDLGSGRKRKMQTDGGIWRSRGR